MGNSYPKSNRLLTSIQYQTVYRNPKKFYSEFILVLAIKNGLPNSRLGLMIKKKNVKHSSQRNTIKRIIRESFRSHSEIVSAGLDLVVIVHKFVPKKQLSTYLDHQWKNILSYYRKA